MFIALTQTDIDHIITKTRWKENVMQNLKIKLKHQFFTSPDFENLKSSKIARIIHFQNNKIFVLCDLNDEHELAYLKPYISGYEFALMTWLSKEFVDKARSHEIKLKIYQQHPKLDIAKYK